MYRVVHRYLSDKFLSRWVVLAFDTVMVAVFFQYAYLIRFGFDYSEVERYIDNYQSLFVTSIYFILFFVTKSYSGIIRHTGLEDTIKIIKASIVSGFIILLFSFVVVEFHIIQSDIFIPKGVIIIHSLLVVLTLILSRLSIRSVFNLSKSSGGKEVRVSIYGAGYVGEIAKRTLLNDSKVKYKIVSFIDDNSSLNGKLLYGIRVESSNKALKRRNVLNGGLDEVVIAINNISIDKRNEIVEECLSAGVKVRIIPSIDKWVNGELSSGQISEVNIEDLLDRPAIVLDNHYVEEEIQGKTILVTGAAGSIGSEIIRQLMSKKPNKVILFEQAESPLHDLRIELESGLSKNYSSVEVKYIIGDVRDRILVHEVFKKYRPDVVYHAAAYKHVPLMEEYPNQAVATNVIGTKNIADASAKVGASKFVMVSTDKAVNPTNVMGASKRIAEIYIQSLSTIHTGTKFITTRFGNVLGSNGSVIPLFRKQIKEGGPVTVTDKGITRFFMTIPEACQLVLEAGAMGKESEIFIFDMGSPIKIFDLAKKMIQLSGLNYPKDIDVVFTGLRPGEKLYEELLAKKEETLPTYHPKIMIAEVRGLDYIALNKNIKDLVDSLPLSSKLDIVHKMKKIVPEFISNNSKYEKLDKK